MIVGLDTSVVVRLLVGQPESQARVASERLRRLHAAGEKIIVTDLALAEAYHALHYHYGVPKVAARNLLRLFIDSGIVLADPGCALSAFAAAGGAGFVDRLIHARHRAQGGITLTFEQRQGRLEGAERLR